jgi:hypothetical protein
VCAAGLMCTWQPLAGHGPLAASSLLPAATDTSAVCVPCLPGQYCPQGTAFQVGVFSAAVLIYMTLCMVSAAAPAK